MLLSSHYKPASTGGGGIIFPKLESWNGETKTATIAAQVNKQRVLCRVTQQTLSAIYGGSDQDPMRSVAEHRFSIQEAARTLIENNLFEEDGSILIRTLDLVKRV